MKRINPSMVERIVYNAVKSALNPMPRGAKCSTGDSEEFEDWFGESKVVDNKGQPQIVFHGTTATKPFSKFKTEDFNSENTQTAGAYFTPNKKIALEYAGGNESKVFKAYLSLQNPFMGDIRDFYEQYPEYQEGLGIPAYEAYDANSSTEHFVEQGYDGQIDDWQIIAFYPEQIRQVS
jgi:hypothetical protein